MTLRKTELKVRGLFDERSIISADTANLQAQRDQSSFKLVHHYSNHVVSCIGLKSRLSQSLCCQTVCRAKYLAKSKHPCQARQKRHHWHSCVRPSRSRPLDGFVKSYPHMDITTESILDDMPRPTHHPMSQHRGQCHGSIY
jgi:hypothetical protein